MCVCVYIFLFGCLYEYISTFNFSGYEDREESHTGITRKMSEKKSLDFVTKLG